MTPLTLKQKKHAGLRAVDLVRRRVEVMTHPNRAAERYDRVRTFKEGQTLPLPQGQRVAVLDILPPKRA